MTSLVHRKYLLGEGRIYREYVEQKTNHKQKWHLSFSIEEKHFILLATFVLPLPFKKEKSESQVNESREKTQCKSEEKELKIEVSLNTSIPTVILTTKPMSYA